MRKAVIAVVLSLGLSVVWAETAAAAPTRTEYVAQVDPICQSAVGPLGTIWHGYNKTFKRVDHAVKVGNTKGFLTGTKRLSQLLNSLARTRTGMVDQIAAVPPPDADAGTIGTWLGDLRQEAGFEYSAANAVLKLQIGKFFQRLHRADAASTAGKGAIAAFGFHVCGVFPAT
jgi:hypothetical protein